MEISVEKLPIAEKAYTINLDKIDEGYLYSETYVHENSRAKAKFLLLKEIRYDNYRLKYGKNDDELNFITIPMIRAKYADKVLFENKVMLKSDVEYVLEKRKHNEELDTILNNPDIKYCYIRKRGSYYCSNWGGYTEYKHLAGVYKKEEAVAHNRNVMEVSLVPINIIEHNKVIQEKINELTSKILS